MTYKNSPAVFVMLGLLSGVSYGIVMIGVLESLMVGLVAGIAFAVLFTLLFLFLNVKEEKKFGAMHAEISQTKTVICNGPANYKSSGGWIFFTSDSFDYVSKSILGDRSISIPTSSIASVRALVAYVEVTTTSMEKYKFRVVKPKLWEISINQELEGSKE